MLRQLQLEVYESAMADAGVQWDDLVAWRRDLLIDILDLPGGAATKIKVYVHRQARAGVGADFQCVQPPLASPCDQHVFSFGSQCVQHP